MSLTLPIEIGKKYVRRDGKVVTAATSYCGLSVHTFASIHHTDDELSDQNPALQVWRGTGRVNSDHEMYSETGAHQMHNLSVTPHHKYDLVEDYVEKEQEMKMIENGIGKDMYIVGSFKEDGLSFSKEPQLHNCEAQARAEALRLTKQEGRKFVWLKVCGAVKSAEVVWD